MVNVCSGGWRWLHEYANELLEPIESRRENKWEKEENVIDYQLFVNEGLSVCYWKYCWQVLNIWKAKRGVKRVESLNLAPAGDQVQDALDVTLWSTSVFEVNDGHVDAQWETGRIERLWLPSMTMISGHCWCSGVACLQRVRRCNFTWPAGFFLDLKSNGSVCWPRHWGPYASSRRVEIFHWFERTAWWFNGIIGGRRWLFVVGASEES